ncbi:hypothetical protein GCM10009760_54210 [Kitasatospora kazusensis]|uniref:Uncharacterized protein n=1 Tax=Kitasatospora kazusensis TaxID=407974 RepID=A0ABP5LVK8_9ACTN
MSSAVGLTALTLGRGGNGHICQLTVSRDRVRGGTPQHPRGTGAPQAPRGTAWHRAAAPGPAAVRDVPAVRPDGDRQQPVGPDPSGSLRDPRASRPHRALPTVM